MKRNIKAKLVVLIGIMAVMIAAVTGCGSSKKVNLDMSDYISVSFSGTDGDGTGHIGIYYSPMELDYAGVTDDNPDSDQIQKMLELAEFESTIYYHVSPDSGLSNGDEVEVTVSYDSDIADELGITVSGTDYTVTVEGLTEE